MFDNAEQSINPFAPVLAVLVLRSYGRYMKGTLSVGVEVDDGGALEVTPMRNGGAREGFVDITDKACVLEDFSPEGLGAAVEEAMTQAEK